MERGPRGSMKRHSARQPGRRSATGPPPAPRRTLWRQRDRHAAPADHRCLAVHLPAAGRPQPPSANARPRAASPEYTSRQVQTVIVQRLFAANAAQSSSTGSSMPSNLSVCVWPHVPTQVRLWHIGADSSPSTSAGAATSSQRTPRSNTTARTSSSPASTAAARTTEKIPTHIRSLSATKVTNG